MHFCPHAMCSEHDMGMGCVRRTRSPRQTSGGPRTHASFSAQLNLPLIHSAPGPQPPAVRFGFRPIVCPHCASSMACGIQSPSARLLYFRLVRGRQWMEGGLASAWPPAFCPLSLTLHRPILKIQASSRSSKTPLTRSPWVEGSLLFKGGLPTYVTAPPPSRWSPALPLSPF